MSNDNIFYLDTIFPDSKFLRNIYMAYSEIQNSCLFVLDANILLSPYSVSEKSFDDIKTIYTKLRTSNRLFVPFRAVQEYARNRGNRIKDLYTKFEKHEAAHPISNVNFDIGLVPFLQGNGNYDKMISLSNNIMKELEEHKQIIAEILVSIKNLYWTDPILAFYKDFISDEIILFNSDDDRKIISETMERRYKCDIPPGFGDIKKPDGGVGDLLIWYSILTLAKDKKQDIVLVSNDKNKEDWVYISGNKSPVAPRFELLNELKRTESSISFNIINFPEFLTSQKANIETIDEITTISYESPYEKISLPTFVGELKETYSYYRSLKDGFLGSRFFVETHLARKGYDIGTSWDIYNNLKSTGAIREYTHIDPSGIHLPLNAIEIVSL